MLTTCNTTISNNSVLPHALFAPKQTFLLSLLGPNEASKSEGSFPVAHLKWYTYSVLSYCGLAVSGLLKNDTENKSATLSPPALQVSSPLIGHSQHW